MELVLWGGLAFELGVEIMLNRAVWVPVMRRQVGRQDDRKVESKSA